jgi:hypothetical protein
MPTTKKSESHSGKSTRKTTSPNWTRAPDVILDTNYVGALVERDPDALALRGRRTGSVGPVRLSTAVI